MMPKFWVSAGEALASALIQATLEPRPTSEKCSPNTPSADAGRWAGVLQSTRVQKGKRGPQQERIDGVFQFSLQGRAKGSGDTIREDMRGANWGMHALGLQPSRENCT